MIFRITVNLSCFLQWEDTTGAERVGFEPTCP